MSTFGVAFDVDGVLYRGGVNNPVPGAVETVQALRDHKVPYVFLTNGTGSTEQEKAAELAELLKMPISSSQVIMASTPMRELAAKYKGTRVMAVSRSDAFSHHLCAEYGFTDVVTHTEYAAAHPDLFPFRKYSAEQACSDPDRPIAAVLLLQSPADWGEALQVTLDVLRSSTGVAGGPDLARDEPQAVHLHSGNPDFDYQAKHSVPRITLGAFRQCLALCFRESLGRELEFSLNGKPYPLMYRYAEGALSALGLDANATIYAVGDNPLSDVRGANGAGDRWYSILTRTGNFRGGDNDPVDPAKHVCDDVREAVRHMCERQGCNWRP